VGLAAGAAFALRYRAIVASSARRAARERIEDAREHRLDWVTIAESGDPATAPYLRLEMHLPEGTAVQASIGLDAETGERRFELAAVALDPATGERSDASTIATPQTFVDAVSWQEAVVLLRGTIEGTAG